MDAGKKRWGVRLFGLAVGVAHAVVWLYGLTVAAVLIDLLAAAMVKRRW